MNKSIISMDAAAFCVGMKIKDFKQQYDGKKYQIGKSFHIFIKDLEEWAKTNGRQVANLAVSPTISD